MEITFEVKVTVDGDVIAEHEVKIENGDAHILAMAIETAMTECQKDVKNKLQQAIG